MKIPKMRNDTPIFKCVFFSFWAIVIILVGSYFMGRPVFYYNTTLSSPLGLYMINPFGDVQYNSYVIVRLNKTYGSLKEGSLMVKQVKGFPGYEYTRKPGVLLLNGKEYPVIESKGLPQIKEGSYTVPEGTLFLLNDRDNSFDGRYYGPTKRSDVVQKVCLVFNVEDFRKKESKIYTTLSEYFPSLKKKESDKKNEK